MIQELRQRVQELEASESELMEKLGIALPRKLCSNLLLEIDVQESSNDETARLEEAEQLAESRRLEE